MRGLEELFSGCAVVSVFLLWWEMVFGFTSVLRVQYMMARRNRYFKYVTYVRHVVEFPPNSSKMEFPPNHQNWIPAKRYSTKITNQNTNHQVPVPVTYRYQPESQYWWKFPPLPPHLPLIPIYLYIAIAYARTSCNDIIMYIRLCLMSIYNRCKRNAEAQLRRFQNPAYRIQEQVADTELPLHSNSLC